jgi:nucleotide-binding universal stress UspA family protein
MKLRTTGIPRHILCPVDFSSCSRAASSYATALAEKLGAELEVVHVYWDVPSAVPIDPAVIGVPTSSRKTMQEFLHDNAEENLRKLVAELPEKWHRRAAQRVVAGDPAPTILNMCASGEYDLVVMGTHGTGALRRLLMGSVADKIVRAAPIPVLVVREDDESD